MTDLLTRLRMDSSYIPGDREAHMLYERERHEAADRIEGLEAENERLRKVEAMALLIEDMEGVNDFRRALCEMHD